MHKPHEQNSNARACKTIMDETKYEHKKERKKKEEENGKSFKFDGLKRIINRNIC